MNNQMMFITGFSSYYPYDKLSVSCKMDVIYITIEKLCQCTVNIKGKTAYIVIEKFITPSMYQIYEGVKREIGYLYHVMKNVLIRYYKELDISKIIIGNKSLHKEYADFNELDIIKELQTHSEKYDYLNVIQIPDARIGQGIIYYPPKFIIGYNDEYEHYLLSESDTEYLPNYRILLDYGKRSSRDKLLYFIRYLQLREKGSVIRTKYLLELYGPVKKTISDVDFVDLTKCREGLCLFRHFDYMLVDYFKVGEYDLFGLLVDYKDLPYCFLKSHEKEFKPYLKLLLMNPYCPKEYIEDHIKDIKELGLLEFVSKNNVYVDETFYQRNISLKERILRRFCLRK